MTALSKTAALMKSYLLSGVQTPGGEKHSVAHNLQQLCD